MPDARMRHEDARLEREAPLSKAQSAERTRKVCMRDCSGLVGVFIVFLALLHDFRLRWQKETQTANAFQTGIATPRRTTRHTRSAFYMWRLGVPYDIPH